MSRVITRIPIVKQREFMGEVLDVPSWTAWIAISAIGEIIAFDHEPELDPIEHTWFVMLGRAQVIGTWDLEGMDWKKSLYRVTEYDYQFAPDGTSTNPGLYSGKKMVVEEKEMDVEEQMELLRRLGVDALLLDGDEVS